MLLQELLGSRTSALVVAEGVALTFLQADPRQAREAVAFEERIEQSNRTLHRPAIRSAVRDHVFAEGGAVTEIELVVVRVPQQHPGLQQLQDPEGGELTDFAVTRVRRQHRQPVKRAQELGPCSPRVTGDILYEIHVVVVDRFEFRRAAKVAAAIDAADVSYVRQGTSVAVADEDQDATQRQIAIKLPCSMRKRVVRVVKEKSCSRGRIN